MRGPSEKENARAADFPGAPNWQLSEEENLKDTPGDTPKQEVSPDVATVQLLLDWLLDYHTRCDRAQLAAEVIGLSDERLAELRHEGAA